MHLSPRDKDRLTLHQVGSLAQKRLARGVRLNHPEAVGLIAAVMLEMIRDGDRRVAELMEIGQRLLGRRQVLPGVAEMIESVQVEGTFRDGTKLLTVHHPIAAEHGDLALALYGSFLPVPSLDLFPAEGELAPGEVITADGQIELNAGREAATLEVVSVSDRPIQVGSHFHFIEVSPYLRFDRERAYGMRLDIPAGTAVRFEPGDTRTVRLVAIAGARVIRGGNGLASGEVSEEGRRAAMERVAARGFGHAPSGE